MAKSGGTDGVISLPKGGGALHGIGEKFSPDLFTGTGNFSIPIALPPGRNGFQPQLNLVYSTGNGNGPFGLGWDLSVPGVSRKTSKGVPRYREAEDVFILSGAEDLVPIAGDFPGEVRYRPRTEGLFALITYHRDSANSYWEVRSKDGLVSLYGTPGVAGSDLAVVADPANPTKAFAWELTRTVDPFGNAIEYEYERDTGEEGPHHCDQLYLKRIRYVDYGDGNDIRFLVSVTFDYEDRPDPFSEYRAGFEIRTRKRCRQITIRTHADEGHLVLRTYRFVYLDERVAAGEVPAEILPRNGVSLLSQVRVIGHDGDVTEALPPLEFGYTRFEPEGRDFFPLEGRDMPAQSLASPDLELADLFGNGLPDILQMNGTVRYWRNLGGGRFDLPREMRDAPAGLQLADPGVQLIDANGDGRIDLLVTANGLNGYFPLQFNGEWDRRSFQRHRQAPSFNLQDPEVQLVDLDGDGVTDAIRSGSRLECFFNDPREGWNGTRRVERRAIEDFPNINFSDPRVRWADMSGDGLQDIVLVYDGNIEYWPNLGHGDWGRRIHMRNSPRFPYGYDPRRILIGDVDGDGLADLVYVDHCKVILWINRSGNDWSDPIEIDGTPPVTDLDVVRLVDLLGAGISGVLWSADANGRARKNMYFLDFTGGLKPYLLHEMDNHMGAVTRVRYRPSTEFYLEDQQRPETRWQTPLPFPVQVVACVEVIDELSHGKLTTEYRYHHGYWDGAEREFRGFGMVEQLDTEAFETYNAPGMHGAAVGFSSVDAVHFSPPTLTRTWFHQGPVGEEHGDWYEADYSREFWPGDSPLLERPESVATFLRRLPRRAKRDALRALRGSILRTELYALDGTERQNRPYTVTESLYGLREEAPPGVGEADRLRIFFPHTLAQRITQWESGDEPMTQFSFMEDYDDYGQSRQQIQIACPRDWHPTKNPASSTYLATYRETHFAQRDDSVRYIVDRVVKTSTYEIADRRSYTVSELKDAVRDHIAAVNLIDQTLSFYDGEAFMGLPLGRLGDYGALVHSETLLLTEQMLNEVYPTGANYPDQAGSPLYFNSDPPSWSDEYPQGFRDRLRQRAGYIYRTGADVAEGYYVATEQRCYDFQSKPSGAGRGLLKIARDPLGRDTTVKYDSYELLPTEVTDPVGLTTNAIYDYRVLQAREVTDPNGNRTTYSFTPLNLLASTAVMGKAGEAVGDTQTEPSVRLKYDFLAYMDRRQPISVRMIKREYHVTEGDVPASEKNGTIESMEYSDGFGRLLQTRAQAEDIQFGNVTFGNEVLPARQAEPSGNATGRLRTAGEPDNVVVSGWQVYDNKGRVVKKYEPFYAKGWDFIAPEGDELGQKITMYYDLRGQVIRTVNPDGSEQRVIYGIPKNISEPQQFAPTPWEAYTYDANDNAGRTHGTGDSTHWDTPTSIEIDALGRTVKTVERNGANYAKDWYTTRSTYDIRGNLLTVTDTLGRVVFRYSYDLANNPLRIESIDAGIRRTVLDAAGNEIERRDSKGTLILQAYDMLNRPTHLWARDGLGQPLTLRERLQYGDGGTPAQNASERSANRSLNRLGQLYRHYDETGLLTFEAYDFKGNELEKVRQVISDAVILSVFPSRNDPAPNWNISPFRVDWEPPTGGTLEDRANALLDSQLFQTSVSYDALNRIKVMHYPRDVNGERKQLRPQYNRAGALEHVELNNTIYVERITYNAKGQRSLVAYGNGIMTRYAYDPETFRLVRIRTDRYQQPNPFIYNPRGAPLQDFAYEYDFVGNIMTIRDRTPDSGTLNSPLGKDALDRFFTYDPLYRLLSTTGRECDWPPTPYAWAEPPFFGSNQRCADLTRTRPYQEQYQYDPLGNMTRLRHEHFMTDGSLMSRNRDFAISPNNNRLQTVTVGQQVYEYEYDYNGNLMRENLARHFEWEHSDRLRVFRIQTSNSEPSVYVHYLYDANGQRIKKLLRKGSNQFEVTVYIGGIFEYHRLVKGGSIYENNTLHVMDDQQRIAMLRLGNAFPDDGAPNVRVKYHLSDHLGSNNLVIDDSANWINREEYTPYGETSYGGFARKRYRFTGKEQDEESGLNYHGSRYYAPWLGRWMSCDPVGPLDGLNFYTAFNNNPVNNIDPYGTQTKTSMTTMSIEGRPDLQSQPEPKVGFFMGLISPTFRFQLANAGLLRPLNEEIEFRPGRTNREIFEEGMARQQRNMIGAINRMGETILYYSELGSISYDMASMPLSLAGAAAKESLIKMGTRKLIQEPAEQLGELTMRKATSEVVESLDPDHHNLFIRVFRDDTLVDEWWEVSGGMTQAEKELGRVGQWLSHTEPKSIIKLIEEKGIPLDERTIIEMGGQLPPCTWCDSILSEIAAETGTTIWYRWWGKTTRGGRTIEEIGQFLFDPERWWRNERSGRRLPSVHYSNQ